MTDIHELGIATLAALVGALGFRQVHAGEWPDGARMVVERDGRLYVIEITPWSGMPETRRAGRALSPEGSEDNRDSGR